MYKRSKSLLTYVFFIAFTLCSHLVLGQQVPQVIPPSPKTQEFNKYINYDVSYYNGLPEITIPLYSINIKGVSIPISLTYHASGIKYKQDDSDVGVGWTINPGYRVSRTIYGFPDEKKNMPGALMDSLNIYDAGNSPLKRDNFLAKFLEPALNARPSTDINHQFDGEYDQFNYSTPVESGAFIINDRVNKTVKNITYSNMKTAYKTDPSSDGIINGITGLQLKDANGNKYSYGEWNPRNGNFVFETNSGVDGTVPSAWAITDISNPFGENVHFNYSRISNGEWMNHIRNISFVELAYTDRYPVADMPIAFYPSSISDISEGVDGNYSTFSLDNIVSPEERIEFKREMTTYGNQIREMNVYANGIDLLRKIKFYYSNNSYRTFLDSISISGGSSINVEVYRFEYYDKGRNFSPAVLVPDQWGYYKIEANQYNIFHEEFGYDFGNFSSTGTPAFQSIGPLMPGRGKRDFIPEVPNYFSLKKITYPTGGGTEYEYESNAFDQGQGSPKNGGGIRIKAIESNDLNGEGLIRRFEYGINRSGWGYPTLRMNPAMFVNETLRMKVHPWQADRADAQRVVTYNSSLQGDVDPGGFLSSNVVYPEVIEYYGPSNNIGVGKTVYNYDLGIQYSVSSLPAAVYDTGDLEHNVGPKMQYHSFSPQYVTNYRLWNKPVLTQKRIYNEQSGIYNIVKKERYIYSYSFETFPGLKVRPFVTAESYTALQSDYYRSVSSFFNYGTYNVETGLTNLVQKEEVNYFPDSVKTSTAYTYNSFNQLIKEVNISSQNETIENLKNYPLEMVQTSNDPSGVYQKMLDDNVIDPVIESFQRNNNNEIARVRNNYYNPYPGQFLPQLVQIKNNKTGLMEDRLRYYKYSKKGNPLSLSKEGGLKINYIWSYMDKYPVAEIRNADYLAIENILGGPNIDVFQLARPDRISLDNFLAPLKSTLSGAQITSYVYKPLFGMTSQTSPTGLITHYQYDDFQRLKFIRDQHDNIIKTYDYSYSRGAKKYHNRSAFRNMNRNDCGAGYYGSSVKYTVNAGTYTSDISEAEVLALVDNDLNANAQNNANRYGSCSLIYYNTAASADFRRNDCIGGGSMVTYTVVAGKYNSIVSQQDVDAKAQQDLSANGQAYANIKGTCSLYHNKAKSQIYFRNNCGPGFKPGPGIVYTVPAGTYSSTISQEDADLKADNDANLNGQNSVNTNGSCIIIPQISINYTNNDMVSDYYIKFHNNTTNQEYVFAIYSGGDLGSIPEGDYDVHIYNQGGATQQCGFELAGQNRIGLEATFQSLLVGPETLVLRLFIPN